MGTKIRNLLKTIWKYLKITFRVLWIFFLFYMAYRSFYHLSQGDHEKALISMLGVYAGITLLEGDE